MFARQPSNDVQLSLATLVQHDHPCSIYQSKEELKKQFVPYLRAGLLLEEKCVYFIDENDEKFVIDAMKEDGFELQPYLASKQFEIIHTGNAHLKGGYFSEEKMLAYWNTAIASAKKAGFKALRAAVEMTWALSGKPGCEILAPYESRLTNLMKEKDASVICMYSRHKFTPEKIKAIIHAHPLVVVDDKVFENVACPPPELFTEGCNNLDVQASLDNLELIRELRETKYQREKQLKEAEVFKLLVAGVKDYAIFRLDKDGMIMTWNGGAERIKGYSKDEIFGQHFSVFYTPEAKKVHHPDKELMIAKKDGRYEEEGWRVRKNGSLFWANVVITALFEDGEHVGFAKITRDLTERRNAEKAKEVAHTQLERANDELQHLAFVISHELQEPISAMTSYSKLLTSRYHDRLGADADEFLLKIETGAKMTARLVDDLWTYARITKPGLQRSNVNTADLLQKAKDDLADIIQSRDVEIVSGTAASFPSVEVHKDQLQYVFTELLQNAVKHNTRPVAPKIEVTVVQERGGWSFNFKDNGPGIDRFFSQQVFSVFKRLGGKLDETGTGMGLAICKKIVEDQYHGKIGFESIAGDGATFFFWLPSGDCCASD